MVSKKKEDRPLYALRDPVRPSSRASLAVDLKQMILGALSALGGQAYLERQAEEQPVAFMTLLGKILPLQVKGDFRRDVNDISDAELIAIACSRAGTEEKGSAEEPNTVH